MASNIKMISDLAMQRIIAEEALNFEEALFEEEILKQVQNSQYNVCNQPPWNWMWLINEFNLSRVIMLFAKHYAIHQQFNLSTIHKCTHQRFQWLLIMCTQVLCLKISLSVQLPLWMFWILLQEQRCLGFYCGNKGA